MQTKREMRYTSPNEQTDTGLEVKTAACPEAPAQHTWSLKWRPCMAEDREKNNESGIIPKVSCETQRWIRQGIVGLSADLRVCPIF